MTAEIINLRKVRKQRARAEAERTAEAKRAKFGRTKHARQLDDDAKSRAAKILDGAKREKEDSTLK